jgi:RNA polymerase sigma-70 factor, ECF subfamily
VTDGQEETVELTQSAPTGVQLAATLQSEANWQYNRWLGRWRKQAGPSVGSSCQVLAGPEVLEAESRMPFDDSDRTLVERVKAGDVRAFEMLHRRYYARIYRFAFLRLGNAEDAADVASHTFCKALSALHSYQFKRTESIYPWLHRIASNAVVDVVRDRPAGGMLSLDAQAAEDVDSFLEYLPDDGLSPQELVERSEVQEVVRQAINKLPANQARAIALRFLGDLSIREIAQSLGITEGAVKSLLHRALQGMRQHLKSATETVRTATTSASTPVRSKAESHVPEVIHLHQRDS